MVNGHRTSMMGKQDFSPPLPSEAQWSASSLIKRFGAHEIGGRATSTPVTTMRSSTLATFRKKEPLFIDKHKEKARSTTNQQLSNLMHGLKRKVTQNLNFAQRSVNETLHYRVRLARATNDSRTEEEIKLSHLLTLFKNSEERVKQSLRPSRRSLKNRERLLRERKELERRLRGVLGRQRLPERLEEEQEAKVEETFQKAGKIAQIPGAAVESRDITKLLPSQWLNDEVINFYLKLIEQRSNYAAQKRKEANLAQIRINTNKYDESKDDSNNLSGDLSLVEDVKKRWNGIWNVHVFNTFFFEKLSKQGFNGVRQWTRKVDVFTKDLVLFPINVGQMHWVCAAINMRRCRFEYYDSMHSEPGAHLFDTLTDYLASEYVDKKKNAFGPLDLRGWQRYCSRQSPIQQNGSDCGVFATMTIEQLSRRDPWLGPMLPSLDAEQVVKQSATLSVAQKEEGKESLESGYGDEEGRGRKAALDHRFDDENVEQWNFSQEDMAYLRRRMVFEIVSCTLLE